MRQLQGKNKHRAVPLPGGHLYSVSRPVCRSSQSCVVMYFERGHCLPTVYYLDSMGAERGDGGRVRPLSREISGTSPRMKAISVPIFFLTRI